MKWLRKKIIDWLFGVDYISYEEIYKNYVETSNEYINYLDRNKKRIDLIVNLTNNLFDLNEKLLHQNKVFIQTLKENGIDVNKINFNKEV